jgi:HEAT repeat protein
LFEANELPVEVSKAIVQLESPSEDSRAQAITTLEYHDSEEANDALVEACKSRQLDVAINAGLAIVRKPNCPNDNALKGLSRITELTYQRISGRTPDRVRLEVATALGKIDHEDAVDLLIKLLNVTDIQREVLSSLGELKAEKSVRFIIESTAQLKQKIGALGNIGGTEAAQYLTAIIEDASNSRLHPLAIRALGRTRNNLALPILREQLISPQKDIYIATIDALQMLATAEARTALEEAASNTSIISNQRQQIRNALKSFKERGS